MIILKYTKKVQFQKGNNFIYIIQISTKASDILYFLPLNCMTGQFTQILDFTKKKFTMLYTL